MVEGQVSGGDGGGPSLAIDQAIGILDSLILRLQSSGEPPSETQKSSTAVDSSSSAEAKEQSPLPDLKSLKLTAEEQETDEAKKKILDRPGKKPIKLPGAPAEKSSKPSTKQSTDNSSEEENFDKAHFQIGRVQSVDDHPVAEKLYVCKVEVAPGQVRQVVAGLKNFVPASELEGKKVALVLNLKAAKLAGQTSEAMILAGDSVIDGVSTVKVLEPPSNAAVGDRIYLEGRTPSDSPAKQLSSKVWEKIVPLLKVEGKVATFNKTALVTSSGAIAVSGLPDGAGIH